MRPRILYTPFKPVTNLKGIGARIAKGLENFVGTRIIDLYWHLPNGLIDRRYAPNIAEAETGRIATLTVSIDKHIKPPHKRLPYKVITSDQTGSLVLVFFHARSDYLHKTLPEGEIRVVSGICERFGQELQMTHPDRIGTIIEIDQLKTIEPVYPLSAGVSLKVLSKAIGGAMSHLPKLDEWLNPSYLKKNNWKSWQDSLFEVHRPLSLKDLEPKAPARRRLAYDELLANQLALSLMRLHMHKSPGRGISGDQSLQKKAVALLPFKLTPSQLKSCEEIANDMASNTRMLRLLQGDVGSGKTIVSLLAMLSAIEAGTQSVLMAPTEILARQHIETLEPIAKSVGIRLQLLTGRYKGRKREAILENLKNGSIHLAVGTHALFQDDVEFKNLGLAVIDEQHRFGVHQRLSLTSKGHSVNVLVMTATPIPRTLMLSAYGDMDVSRLSEKPAGRKPIITTKLNLNMLEEAIKGVKRQIDNGARAYWVCPLVDESDVLNVAAAEDRHRALVRCFGNKVGLVHGRMKGIEKDKVIDKFATGKINVLVATTVIEVGVDVPEATIMVIEHAERFGLAQLHQLRGRVGRGSEQSYCLLMYQAPLSATASKRIDILRETDDGFVIAEKDLHLRGAGELLGTRQSGLPNFRLVDLEAHSDIIETARDEAKLILSKDPDLESERGKSLRTLLYLFERDAAVKYLRSG
ncbi:MAG: ATP-dependent DNA helicase RecG [Magnetovibrio sp.]|nr:ATP-dependent DNA helicase RecG [Magnetovibrio sp.]|tara:strand:- start:5162 stop:7243 length:2082 start_codon:yes stop_codon:yes gene_type:complete